MFKRIIIRFGRFYFRNSSKPSFIKVEKIAIIKSGAIGDILMTTPMVRALKKKYPDAKITYITAEKFRSVIDDNKFIDKIMTFDAEKLFGSNIISRIIYFKKFAKVLRSENFDVCFILDKSYLAGQFAKRCNIPIRIGFDRFGEGFANTHNVEYKTVKHEIEYYLELLKFANVPENGKRMDLFITKKDEAFASGFLKKNKIKNSDIIIGIAPAATKDPKIGRSSRTWSEENYKNIVERVSKYYSAKIIFFGSRDDTVIINNIMSKVGSKTFSCAGKTKLKQAAALIKLCDLFIAHDSGLVHVASAMNVPVVSIFGPTDPRRKAPLNEKSVYLWKDNGSCELCEVFGKFPYCDNHAKTESVGVEDVLKAVDSIINV